MGVFDDIIKNVPAEDLAIINKYPHLKASVETLEQETARAKGYAQQWTDWAGKHYDHEHKMTKAEYALMQEAEALRAQIAAPGTDAATVADLRKELKDKTDEILRENQKAIGGMNVFYGTVAAKMLPHHQEFGEVLDQRKLMEFMSTNNIADPSVGYEMMMAPRRAEIASAKAKEQEAANAKAIEEARKAGYEQHAKEVGMGTPNALPTDQSGGIAGVTAFVAPKAATISDAEKSVIQAAKLGDGSLPALGYEMYRRGDFAATQ